MKGHSHFCAPKGGKWEKRTRRGVSDVKKPNLISFLSQGGTKTSGKAKKKVVPARDWEKNNNRWRTGETLQMGKVRETREGWETTRPGMLVMGGGKGTRGVHIVTKRDHNLVKGKGKKKKKRKMTDSFHPGGVVAIKKHPI